MSTDRARRSHDPSRKYRSVVSQQGRVSVEADANETEEVEATTLPEASTLAYGAQAPTITNETGAAQAPASASERAYGTAAKGKVAEASLAEFEAELVNAETSIERKAPTDELEPIDARLDELEGKLERMGEWSEEQALRLQMLMDRRAKFLETLSNLMKKASDTQSSITANLK